MLFRRLTRIAGLNIVILGSDEVVEVIGIGILIPAARVTLGSTS